MKKKMVSVLLAAAMGTTALVGFGTTAYADDDVLEFYHGYYQDESEWAAAQVIGISMMNLQRNMQMDRLHSNQSL